MVRKYKYNLVVAASLDVPHDYLVGTLQDILGYDITQIRNCIHMLRQCREYVVKSYTNKSTANDDCTLMNRQGLYSVVYKVAIQDLI